MSPLRNRFPIFGGTCPICNAPDEEAPLCADCGERPATEPVNRYSRIPRYCRDCDQARREEAADGDVADGARLVVAHEDVVGDNVSLELRTDL